MEQLYKLIIGYLLYERQEKDRRKVLFFACLFLYICKLFYKYSIGFTKKYIIRTLYKQSSVGSE